MKKVKVEEAVKRLKKMGVLPEAIEHFERSGRVYMSMTPYGILYRLTKQQKEVIKRFEEKYNAVV